MSLNDDLQKLILRGKTRDEFLPKIPTIENTIDRLQQSLRSNYPLIDIGTVEEGTVPLSEEDFSGNIHILGIPGMGKSKLLELLIRAQIDRMKADSNAPSICFIDGSDYGDTYYKILKYCIDIGFDRVCLIDPNDIERMGCVPSINPLIYTAMPRESIETITDSFRLLWKGDRAQERRLNKFMSSLIALLHADYKTLAELIYFSDRDIPEWHEIRMRMLNSLHTKERMNLAYWATLYRVFYVSRSAYNWESFTPAVNVTEPLWDDTMRLIFGSNKNPLRFVNLASGGWLTLVNLAPSRVVGDLHRRLIGTLLINQFINAIDVIRDPQPDKDGKQKAPNTKPFTLYIDEVGQFVTSKLTQILDTKRKSHIQLVVAHQRWDQIKDDDLESALYGGSVKMHVMFYVGNPKDRMKMVELLYGGDLKDRDVSQSLKSALKKQRAVVSIDKKAPIVATIKQVDDTKASDEDVLQFKRYVYEQSLLSGHYPTVPVVEAEIKQRFAQGPTKPFGGRKGEPRRKKSDPVAPQASTVSDHQAASGTDAGSPQLEEAPNWRSIKTPFDQEPE